MAAGDRRAQAWSLQNLAWVTTTRGDFAGADAALGRAARLFAELRDPAGRAWLRGTTAFARLLAGRLTEARRLARVFLPFGERVGEAWAVGTLRAVEAFAAAELGELAEADREARRAYRDFAAADDDWGRGFALVVRGVVARGLGEPAHAADLLTDALACGERTGHPLLIGMAGTMRGFVSLDARRSDRAEADAERTACSALMAAHNVLPAVLLSATPLEDDAHGFFRLLQLLRPQEFPEDMSFEARLASRHASASMHQLHAPRRHRRLAAASGHSDRARQAGRLAAAGGGRDGGTRRGGTARDCAAAEDRSRPPRARVRSGARSRARFRRNCAAPPGGGDGRRRPAR